MKSQCLAEPPRLQVTGPKWRKGTWDPGAGFSPEPGWWEGALCRTHLPRYSNRVLPWTHRWPQLLRRHNPGSGAASQRDPWKKYSDAVITGLLSFASFCFGNITEQTFVRSVLVIIKIFFSFPSLEDALSHTAKMASTHNEELLLFALTI